MGWEVSLSIFSSYGSADYNRVKRVDTNNGAVVSTRITLNPRIDTGDTFERTYTPATAGTDLFSGFLPSSVIF